MGKISYCQNVCRISLFLDFSSAKIENAIIKTRWLDDIAMHDETVVSSKARTSSILLPQDQRHARGLHQTCGQHWGEEDHQDSSSIHVTHRSWWTHVKSSMFSETLRTRQYLTIIGMNKILLDPLLNLLRCFVKVYARKCSIALYYFFLSKVMAPMATISTTFALN